MIAMRPEVYGALSVAARHQRAVMWADWPERKRHAFARKHQQKAQKLRARAERLASTTAEPWGEAR